MKKIILLIFVFTLISCDDNLNKTETEIVERPTLCPELPTDDTPPLCPEIPTVILDEVNDFPIFSGIQSVTDIGTNTVRVNWEHSPEVHHFNILSIFPDRRELIKTVFNPATHTFLKGLSPDTEYTFMIRAMDKQGKIDLNKKVVTFKTLPWPIFGNTKSLSFNGNQFVNIGKSSNFNSNGGKTVSLWFNQNAKEGGSVMVDRLFTFFDDSIASSGLSVAIEDNKFTLLYTNKSKVKQSLAVTKNFSNGQWQHLVVTYNNKFITLYLNGKKILKVKDTLADFGSHPAKIGAFTYRHGFDGHIDEFAYYKASMNNGEVKSLYNSGSTHDLSIAVKNKKLVSWYRLGDHSNDGAYHVEDVISGFHGTPNAGDEFTYKLSTP